MILLSITLFGLLLRLFQLDTLPGEIWGDVIEHYKLTQSILHGDFFFDYRFGGDGPLFSYVNSFLSFFFGLSFYSLKLSTAIAGTLLVFFSFYLTQEYFKNKKISYITSFLMAISFWSLSFSRQAKPHIFVPFFITLTFLFALKKKKILSGLFLGLGMYTQAGFWGT